MGNKGSSALRRKKKGGDAGGGTTEEEVVHVHVADTYAPPDKEEEEDDSTIQKVKESIPTKDDTNASRIQAIWKSHRARSQQEVLSNWKIFNDLENHEEAEMYNLSSFLQALHAYMPHPQIPSSLIDSPVKDNQQVLGKQLSLHIEAIDISEMYVGVRLDSPITVENVLDLVDSFKQGQLLHESYVKEIISAATDLFQTLPNIKPVTIAPAPHVTIVGDLHGQLQDLLLIFRENGFPSDMNPYVFNGDFVDRGACSVEITLVIYAFQVLYPSSVHINRGNHEDSAVTTVFGFMQECQEKYNSYIYEMFIESFKWLPLGSVIDSRILVLHGGLTKDEDVTLSEIASLPRWDYVLARPTKKPKKEEEKLRQKQLNVVRDLLWSDPQKGRGTRDNKRGAGILFGPDVCEKFLRKNDLQLLIRSHECVPKGFLWPYGSKGMLVTLFSASNYCGKAHNLGAFMRIPADTAQHPSFFQYMASSEERDLVSNNLDGIFSLIIENREALLSAFQKVDTSASGKITFFKWSRVMEQTLHIKLQWARIQPLLTSTDEKGWIPYEEFLDRYKVKATTTVSSEEEEHARHHEIFNALYRHRAKLEALFRVFDTDGDGVINREEFAEGIKLLNAHLPAGMKTFDKVNELMYILDFSHDNEININEFMECFRINARLTVAAKWRRARCKLKSLTMLKKFGMEGAAKRLSARPPTEEVVEEEEGHPSAAPEK